MIEINSSISIKENLSIAAKEAAARAGSAFQEFLPADQSVTSSFAYYRFFFGVLR